MSVPAVSSRRALRARSAPANARLPILDVRSRAAYADLEQMT